MRPTQGRRSQNGRLRTSNILAGVAVVALIAAACGDNGGDEPAASEPATPEEPTDDEPDDAETDQSAEETAFPEEGIDWILTHNPGGGADTAARQLAPYLSEALGVSVDIENIGGAANTIGTNIYMEQPADCYTLLHTPAPSIFFAEMVHADTVEFDYAEDLYPIGLTETNPAIYRVRNDAPWDTLEELIEDARERPGEIRVSVSEFTSNGYLALIDLANAMDVEFNVVAFGGGGDARNALLGGEVDLTVPGVFNSLGIADDTRVLGIQYGQNDWLDITDDAPTVNEALGLDLAPNESNYAIMVHRACVEDYPERFEVLVDAYNEARETAEFNELLEELGKSGSVPSVDPEPFFESMLDARAETHREFEERPELSEG